VVDGCEPMVNALGSRRWPRLLGAAFPIWRRSRIAILAGDRWCDRQHNNREAQMYEHPALRPGFAF